MTVLTLLHGRDVKPHNLLLTGTGRLLLTDFNSAAPLTAASSPPKFTTTSSSTRPVGVARKYALTLIGTVDYIAPEILKDGESMLVDSSGSEGLEEIECSEVIAYGSGVDVWSLGAVMFEVSTVWIGVSLTVLTLEIAAVWSNAFLRSRNPGDVRANHQSCCAFIPPTVSATTTDEARQDTLNFPSDSLVSGLACNLIRRFVYPTCLDLKADSILTACSPTQTTASTYRR